MVVFIAGFTLSYKFSTKKIKMFSTKSRGESEKRSKCFFTYIHLDHFSLTPRNTHLIAKS